MSTDLALRITGSLGVVFLAIGLALYWLGAPPLAINIAVWIGAAAFGLFVVILFALIIHLTLLSDEGDSNG